VTNPPVARHDERPWPRLPVHVDNAHTDPFPPRSEKRYQCQHFSSRKAASPTAPSGSAHGPQSITVSCVLTRGDATIQPSGGAVRARLTPSVEQPNCTRNAWVARPMRVGAGWPIRRTRRELPNTPLVLIKSPAFGRAAARVLAALRAAPLTWDSGQGPLLTASLRVSPDRLMKCTQPRPASPTCLRNEARGEMRARRRRARAGRPRRPRYVSRGESSRPKRRARRRRQRR
jgi:hypothetical protein